MSIPKVPPVESGLATSAAVPVVSVRNLTHRYGRTVALDGLNLDIPAGQMIGLIGPDGVGKSTLMGLVAGAKKLQSGDVTVLNGDMRDAGHRDNVCPKIAYMPQGLGKNLYLELSVFENIDFFARLFGVPNSERKHRIDALLKATGLAPFPDRPAGQLSGGMKQKVGLCGALIHDPDLLILDEPTTGVDPLSRQQFWKLIDEIRGKSPQMSVLVSTAYMDEAQRFDWIVAMDAGKVLDTGTPQEIMDRTRTSNLEAAFVALLPEEKRGDRQELVIPPHVPTGGEPAIFARHLTRRFGKFVAVNDVSFSIDKGEIFGFLGSNGSGKSTTMKMLTGLLPASEGDAKLFGETVNAGSIEIRKRVGYMSQAFSLYGELTVRQNLALHARLYHLPTSEVGKRISGLVERFGLVEHLDHLSDQLPLGLRQRLSLAVAVLHEPEILILDEPTSGVDPIARDEFWELLIDLSRKDNVTIFVSTHFMNEALRCDRISLMHAGTVLACDTPQRLMETRQTDDLEVAFISYIAEAEGELETARQQANPAADDHASRELAAESVPGGSVQPAAHQVGSRVSLNRMLAYSRREALEILRDPVRLAFAFIGSALLMFVFGLGISMDVEDIPFAAMDGDDTPESRAYIAQFEGSRYFLRRAPAASADEVHRRLIANQIQVGIEIPPNFGREVKRGGVPEVLASVDGANPSRAETIKQYVEGVNANSVSEYASLQPEGGTAASQISADIQARFMYNPTFESIYAIVPSVPPIILILIPSILMAVSVVREKELGSIINFYVTPTRKVEFLLGKQLPYVAISIVNYVILILMSIFIFDVPIKGSFIGLTLCALAYVIVTTGIGMLISTFTSSQVAAVFITAILTIIPTIQFSGMLQPVSTLEGSAKMLGTIWPTTYYMHASVGAFTKGLGLGSLLLDLVVLLAFVPVLLSICVAALPGQEK
ncbi:ribosome-associated ATPase/putative transporter RbbA [Schlesneria sp. DSM 10557]|uniref:ribosome-associated ATPase/putative transporter RbbA n=1 Tax=Schlesneria sp. DSM 10557 TaxID=3044399 RepID=UPI0035A0D54E